MLLKNKHTGEIDYCHDLFDVAEKVEEVLGTEYGDIVRDILSVGMTAEEIGQLNNELSYAEQDIDSLLRKLRFMEEKHKECNDDLLKIRKGLFNRTKKETEKMLDKIIYKDYFTE